MKDEVILGTEQLFSAMKEALLEDGYIAPAYIFIGKNGQRVILEAGEDPMGLAEFVSGVARDTSVGLILATETWYVDTDAKSLDEADRMMDGLPPSRHPNRKEAIGMLVFDDEGNAEMWMQPFDRNEEGDPMIVDEDYVTQEIPYSRLNPWGHEPDVGNVEG